MHGHFRNPKHGGRALIIFYSFYSKLLNSLVWHRNMYFNIVELTTIILCLRTSNSRYMLYADMAWKMSFHQNTIEMFF